MGRRYTYASSHSALEKAEGQDSLTIYAETPVNYLGPSGLLFSGARCPGRMRSAEKLANEQPQTVVNGYAGDQEEKDNHDRMLVREVPERHEASHMKRKNNFERVGDTAREVLTGLTIRVRRPNEPVRAPTVMTPPRVRRARNGKTEC